MGVGFGGEWIHVYVWLSPFAVHLKLSQHCKLAICQYKIKSKKKKQLSAWICSRNRAGSGWHQGREWRTGVQRGEGDCTAWAEGSKGARLWLSELGRKEGSCEWFEDGAGI